MLGSFSSLRRSFDEGDEGRIFEERSQVGLQDSRHVNTLLGLIVLQNAAHCARSGAQSGVEHVDKLAVLASAGDNAQSARLIVSAVRGRDEFAVDLQSREEGFEIVFLGGSIVQLTRDNVYDFVAEAELKPIS